MSEMQETCHSSTINLSTVNDFLDPEENPYECIDSSDIDSSHYYEAVGAAQQPDLVNSPCKDDSTC